MTAPQNANPRSKPATLALGTLSRRSLWTRTSTFGMFQRQATGQGTTLSVAPRALHVLQTQTLFRAPTYSIGMRPSQEEPQSSKHAWQTLALALAGAATVRGLPPAACHGRAWAHADRIVPKVENPTRTLLLRALSKLSGGHQVTFFVPSAAPTSRLLTCHMRTRTHAARFQPECHDTLVNSIYITAGCNANSQGTAWPDPETLHAQGARCAYIHAWSNSLAST